MSVMAELKCRVKDCGLTVVWHCAVRGCGWVVCKNHGMMRFPKGRH